MSAALKKEVWEEINALPQRSLISDQVAERWVDGIVTMDPDRAVWHARRARGIGGSEIGEILRRRLGMGEQFKTPERISREKLLLELPEGDNPYIRRGRDLELLAQKVYERLTGRTSVKDQEPYASAFSEAHPQASFAVGNPDDVNETPEKRIIIPDYKVRSTLDWNAPVDLNYIAQCHWYGDIYSASARHSGQTAEISHYCLAELDVPNNLLDGLLEKLRNPEIDDEQRMAMVDRLASQITEWNMRGFGMRITAFDHNQQLVDDMMAAAEQFWSEYVMTGTPYYEPRRLDEPTPAVLNEVKDLVAELGDTRLLERTAGERCTEINARLNDLGRRYDLSEAEIDPQRHAPVSISQTNKFDVTAAAHHLVAQGVDQNSLIKSSGGKLNAERAQKLLERNGIDLSPAIDYDFDTNAVKAAIKNQDDVDVADFQSPGMSASLSRRKAHEAALSQHQESAKAYVAAYARSDDPEQDEEPEAENSASLGMA